MAPGDVFEITFQNWNFSLPSRGSDTGQESSSGSAGTSLPGLKDLFHWSVEADTSNPGNPDVRFESNPALGLDDKSIIADINSRFTYGTSTGDYTFNETGFSLRPTFVIPNGSPSQIEVSTGVSEEVAAGSQGQYTAPFVPDVFSVGQAPTSVALGSFYGFPELAVANSGSNSVSVLWGDGQGVFYSGGTYAVGSQPVSVAMADLTGDGIPDIIVANSASNTVSVLLGNWDGTFYPAGTYAVGLRPVSVAVGDITGDGIPDLIVADAGSNSLSILLGNGEGGFQRAINYPLGGRPTSVAVGDFNGDGISDVAVTTNNFAGEGSVTVLLGTPYGELISVGNYPTGSDAVAVHAGSVYNNAILDLVVVNQLSHDVSVLLANGDGTFQPARNYYVGMEPAGVALADVDGDGIPDLAVTRQRDNSVMLLYGNGDGTFQPEGTCPVGGGPVGLVAGNFNSNGYASDLAVVDQYSSDITILHNVSWGGSPPPGGAFSGAPKIVHGTGTVNGAGHPRRAASLAHSHTLTEMLTVGWSRAVGSQAPVPYRPDLANHQGQVETFGFSASPPLFLGGVPVPVGESNRDGTTNNITPTAAHGRVHGAACEGVTLADLDSFFAFAPAAQ